MVPMAEQSPLEDVSNGTLSMIVIISFQSCLASVSHGRQLPVKCCNMVAGGHSPVRHRVVLAPILDSMRALARNECCFHLASAKLYDPELLKQLPSRQCMLVQGSEAEAAEAGSETEGEGSDVPIAYVIKEVVIEDAAEGGDESSAKAGTGGLTLSSMLHHAWERLMADRQPWAARCAAVSWHGLSSCCRQAACSMMSTLLSLCQRLNQAACCALVRRSCVIWPDVLHVLADH